MGSETIGIPEDTCQWVKCLRSDSARDLILPRKSSNTMDGWRIKNVDQFRKRVLHTDNSYIS